MQLNETSKPKVREWAIIGAIAAVIGTLAVGWMVGRHSLSSSVAMKPAAVPSSMPMPPIETAS
ncbi:MAG: hypothetical protein ABI824_16935, partial [Acidobacteriota bacterium]